MYLALGLFILSVGVYGLVKTYIAMNGVPEDELIVVQEGFRPLEMSMEKQTHVAPTLQVVAATTQEPAVVMTPNAEALTQIAELYQTSQPETTLTPLPTPKPTQEIYGPPDRILIPAIKLDAPIVLAEHRIVKLRDKEYEQWDAPDKFAAGWQETSAELGEKDNLVLIGHHNIEGKVFKDLVNLKEGDFVKILSGEHSRWFKIEIKMILLEVGAPPEARADNAAWLYPSGDERLTLVTCWPPESNTHRLIIVAMAVDM